ncbi:MAG: hypothetical protein Q4C91_08580 [Eubacteriales bacterium]|nr:hypothetical protein [Eubacteriales bacterium]
MAEVIFSKYSNERSRSFAVRTDILKENDGRFVRKTALYPEGRAHVENLYRWYQELGRIYEAAPFVCNRCEKEEGSVRLEYLEGETLEEALDGLLEKGMKDLAAQRLREYLRKIELVYSRAAFTVTEEFQKVFGKVTEEELPGDLTCAPVTNIDMVCQNLVFTEVPTVLDYEWTFAFPVPCRYVLYRVIHYYVDTHSVRAVLKEVDFYREFGITEKERAVYERMEECFQKYITAGHVPMREMFAGMTPGIGTVQMVNGGQLQVFFSSGEGYREENSVLFPIEDGKVVCTAALPKGCTDVRLDPGEQPCAVHIKSLAFDGKAASLEGCTIDKGAMAGEWVYISRPDPNISLIPVPKGAKELQISFEIYGAGAELMERARILAKENTELKAKVKKQAHLIKEMRNTKVWKLYEKYRNLAERKK